MEDKKKISIFISYPRKDNSLSRKWSDTIFNNIINPALTQSGYQKPLRPDGFLKNGFLTTKTINQLITSDLVIVDLTGNNSEVFYQLAILHLIQKPLIYILKENEKISFNLEDAFIVQISANNKKTKTFIKQLKEQIKSAQEVYNNSALKNDNQLINLLSEGNLIMSQKQPLLDILVEISSSVRVIEGQIAKLDSKITSIKGDVRSIQSNTMPSPFVERRLAKLESIKYKVQQKGLSKINTKDI